MTYLLDTQVIVWALSEPNKLKPPVLSIFESGNAIRFISPSSFWELEIKRAKGKINSQFTYEEMLYGLASRELPLTTKHVPALRKLPALHNDPFDRMLVAQAITEGFTLVTSDALIQQYPWRS